MRKKRLPLFAALVTALAAVAAFTTFSGSALADDGNCPNAAAPTSNLVGAHVAVNGDDVTYYFDSLVDRSPSGGVPGLIEYFVCSDSLPDSVAVVAVGADSSAWTDPPAFTNFSFVRPGGNTTNIELDGTENIEMGTASWSGGPPTGYDDILLHINDADECANLGLTGTETCFVSPGTNELEEAADLTASKTADGTYDNTYAWTIEKSAAIAEDNLTTIEYEVVVTPDDGTIDNVKVTGEITVTNPNNAGNDVLISGITDELSDGTDCVVDLDWDEDTDVDADDLTIPGAGSKSYDYSCDLDDTTVPDGLTNEATVSWSDQILADDSELEGSSAIATSDTIAFTGADIDECIDVKDDNGTPNNTADDIDLGTVCVGDEEEDMTFNYSKTTDVLDAKCVEITNIASFETTDDENDTDANGSDSVTVEICSPATMGYWRNHLAPISASCKSNAGCSANGPWTKDHLPVSLGSGYNVTTTAMAKAVFDANSCGSSTNKSAINCLAAQLLAAKLNVDFIEDEGGDASCISDEISDADDFLTDVGYTGPNTGTLDGDAHEG